MSESESFVVDVLDCETYDSRQVLLRISEKEFKTHKIPQWRRFFKKNPEYWFYVESSVSVPLGQATVTVRWIGNGPCYVYSNNKPCTGPTYASVATSPSQSVSPVPEAPHIVDEKKSPILRYWRAPWRSCNWRTARHTPSVSSRAVASYTAKSVGDSKTL